MLRIFKAQVVTDGSYCFARGKEVFCFLKDEAVDIALGRIACMPLYQVAEISGTHAEPAGAIRHRGQSSVALFLVGIIVFKNGAETLEHIHILHFSCKELSVVESLAVVKQQTDIIQQNIVLHIIMPCF